MYPFPLPLIPGSDGAGVRRDTGEEVVILPGLRLGTAGAAPGPDFQILGGPRDGTYAELIALPAENLYPKPRGFSWDEAAAFPLAALTAYRALFAAAACVETSPCSCSEPEAVSRPSPSSSPRRRCARVLVTSSSDEKIDRAGSSAPRGASTTTRRRTGRQPSGELGGVDS